MYAYLFSFLLFTDIIVNNGVKTGILVENHKNKSTGYRWKCKRLHVDPVKKKKKRSVLRTVFSCLTSHCKHYHKAGKKKEADFFFYFETST